MLSCFIYGNVFSIKGSCYNYYGPPFIGCGFHSNSINHHQESPCLFKNGCQSSLEELPLVQGFVSLVHFGPRVADISEKRWGVKTFKRLKCLFITQNDVMSSKKSVSVIARKNNWKDLCSQLSMVELYGHWISKKKCVNMINVLPLVYKEVDQKLLGVGRKRRWRGNWKWIWVIFLWNAQRFSK